MSSRKNRKSARVNVSIIAVEGVDNLSKYKIEWQYSKLGQETSWHLGKTIKKIHTVEQESEVQVYLEKSRRVGIKLLRKKYMVLSDHIASFKLILNDFPKNFLVQKWISPYYTYDVGSLRPRIKISLKLKGNISSFRSPEEMYPFFKLFSPEYPFDNLISIIFSYLDGKFLLKTMFFISSYFQEIIREEVVQKIRINRDLGAKEFFSFVRKFPKIESIRIIQPNSIVIPKNLLRLRKQRKEMKESTLEKKFFLHPFLRKTSTQNDISRLSNLELDVKGDLKDTFLRILINELPFLKTLKIYMKNFLLSHPRFPSLRVSKLNEHKNLSHIILKYTNDMNERFFWEQKSAFLFDLFSKCPNLRAFQSPSDLISALYRLTYSKEKSVYNSLFESRKKNRKEEEYKNKNNNWSEEIEVYFPRPKSVLENDEYFKRENFYLDSYFWSFTLDRNPETGDLTPCLFSSNPDVLRCTVKISTKIKLCDYNNKKRIRRRKREKKKKNSSVRYIRERIFTFNNGYWIVGTISKNAEEMMYSKSYYKYKIQMKCKDEKFEKEREEIERKGIYSKLLYKSYDYSFECDLDEFDQLKGGDRASILSFKLSGNIWNVFIRVRKDEDCKDNCAWNLFFRSKYSKVIVCVADIYLRCENTGIVRKEDEKVFIDDSSFGAYSLKVPKKQKKVNFYVRIHIKRAYSSIRDYWEEKRFVRTQLLSDAGATDMVEYFKKYRRDEILLRINKSIDGQNIKMKLFNSVTDWYFTFNTKMNGKFEFFVNRNFDAGVIFSMKYTVSIPNTDFILKSSEQMYFDQRGWGFSRVIFPSNIRKKNEEEEENEGEDQHQQQEEEEEEDNDDNFIEIKLGFMIGEVYIKNEYLKQCRELVKKIMTNRSFYGIESFVEIEVDRQNCPYQRPEPIFLCGIKFTIEFYPSGFNNENYVSLALCHQMHDYVISAIYEIKDLDVKGHIGLKKEDDGKEVFLEDISPVNKNKDIWRFSISMQILQLMEKSVV